MARADNRGVRHLTHKVTTAVAALTLTSCVASCGSSASTGPPVPMPPAPQATPTTAPTPSPVGSADGWLTSVVATSPTSAWAAGISCGPGCVTGSAVERTLILRWDGTRWAPVASPSPGLNAGLNDVTAGPGASAWAVGTSCLSACTSRSAASRPLILHWDGTRWLETASGDASAALYGIAANADGTAWAVGDACASACGTASATLQPLVLHWSGSGWSQTATPPLGACVHLNAVSTSPEGTWVAGFTCLSACGTISEVTRTLILRWDGIRWVQSASPSPGGGAVLAGVIAGPLSTAWAVGEFCVPGCSSGSHVQPLLLRWDGSRWSQVAGPSLAGVAQLTAVSLGPAGTAWAVGHLCPSGCGTATESDQLLVLRWDGARWSQVSSPTERTAAVLSGVTVAPDGTAWAAGVLCSSACGTAQQVVHPVILRWNGKSWAAA